MHEPQFVPARKAAPISPTLVKRCPVTAARNVSNPTEKHAHTSFSPACPAPPPASTLRRPASATGPANKLANACCDGNAEAPLVK